MGGTNTFLKIINPIKAITGNPDLDPVGESMEQAFRNTIEVAQGKQQFGQHENWFGSGQVGDQMNTWFGGSTEANRKAWDDYYAEQAKQEQKWQEFMKKNFGTSYQTSPTPDLMDTEYKTKKTKKSTMSKQQTMTVPGTSLLLDEEDT